MLKTLLKLRMKMLFHSLFRSGRNNKKRNPAAIFGFGVLAVYVLACFLFMFGTTFYSLCAPLVESGLKWYYFAFASIMAFALCFIGNVFATQQQLYDAKDNELLLSMPIAPKYILGSRMLSLLLMDFAYAAMVLVPAGIVYCMSYPVTTIGVVIYVLEFLLLPFFVQAFTCIVAWIISIISSHLRNKNIISMVLSVGFLCVYFYVFSQMNTLLQRLVENGAEIAAAFKRVAFPMYYYGSAIADHSFVQLLLFAACALVLFAAIYLLLVRSFISIATTKRGMARIKYTQKTLKVHSVRSSLLRKELTHFWSNSMYVLNGAMGEILLLIFSVVLLVKREAVMGVIQELPGFGGYIIPFLCTALCMVNSMSLISPPSISLEGKNLWISQSSPIPPKDILVAKAEMQLVICVPATLVASILCMICFPGDLVQMLALLIVPQLYNFFMAFFGVAVGLQFPKFDYINETAAVKSGMPTFVSMMAGFAAVLLPALLYAFLFRTMVSATLYLYLCGAVFGIISALIYHYLGHSGAERFSQLQAN